MSYSLYTLQFPNRPEMSYYVGWLNEPSESDIEAGTTLFKEDRGEIAEVKHVYTKPLQDIMPFAIRDYVYAFNADRRLEKRQVINRTIESLCVFSSDEINQAYKYQLDFDKEQYVFHWERFVFPDLASAYAYIAPEQDKHKIESLFRNNF